MSSLSDDSGEAPQEEHLRHVRNVHSIRLKPPRLASKTKKSGKTSRSMLRDSQSMDDTLSLEGVTSIVSQSQTIVSHDTIKVSNKSQRDSGPAPTSKKRGWKKLRRLISGARVSNVQDDVVEVTEEKSDEVRSSQSVATNTDLADEQRIVDSTILGRRDGIDVILLDEVRDVPETDGDFFPNLSFTGQRKEKSSADVVAHMLWENRKPEIILDGFVPGGEDRWSVVVEREGDVAFRDENQADGGSPTLPTMDLWSSLWGSDPTPTKLTDLQIHEDSGIEDPVLILAAECSVPIDVDEDTFIISTPQHLRTLHDIASVPLARGDFDLTEAIFRKILKGMDFLEKKQLKFLKGTTLHNLAMILLWRGDLQQALATFERAFNHRAKHLPKNHPDTVVSLVRKALVLFALERYDEAIAAMEIAVTMTPQDTLARAKILNNLGAIYCWRKDYPAALKQFALSLEIQRSWLDSSVRRPNLVSDVATTLTNMGRFYMERSEWSLACQVYEEALLLQTTIFSRDDACVLRGMSNLAVAKVKEGHSSYAVQLLKTCARLKSKKFGVGSAPVIETTGMIAYACTKAISTDEASRCLSTVKEWQTSNLPKDHPAVLQTKSIHMALQEALANESTVWV